MKLIANNNEKIIVINDEDYGIVMAFTWNVYRYGRGLEYATATKSGKTIYMHRLIMNVCEGMTIDHIDGDGLNNRRSNLRICKHHENLLNSKVRKDSKSGIKGVYQLKERWRAHIHISGKHKTIGWYDSKEEAAKAYKAASIQAFGEFAR